MEILHQKPKALEYIDLRIQTNMGIKDVEKAEIAIKNSLFTVSIRENNELIGFGRVIGDMGISYLVCDIMVHPEHQKKGIGSIIMNEINTYLDENTDEDAYIVLLAKKPADKLYLHSKFKYSEPASAGMIRKN